MPGAHAHSNTLVTAIGYPKKPLFFSFLRYFFEFFGPKRAQPASPAAKTPLSAQNMSHSDASVLDQYTPGRNNAVQCNNDACEA